MSKEFDAPTYTGSYHRRTKEAAMLLLALGPGNIGLPPQTPVIEQNHAHPVVLQKERSDHVIESGRTIFTSQPFQEPVHKSGISERQYFSSQDTTVPEENTAFGLSESKLGIFTIGACAEAKDILASGPKVLKVATGNPPDPRIIEMVHEYKERFPKGTVVLRFYDNKRKYSLDDDPVVSAKNYFKANIQPGISTMTPEQKQLFTYVTGTNEYDSTPVIDSVEAAGWTGTFWRTLADLIHTQGEMTPLIGQIPVGHPYDLDHTKILAPAIEHIHKLGGALSYHAYSIDYTTDPAIEAQTSLRYRQIHETLTKFYPQLQDLKIILGEVGVDRQGRGRVDGFRQRGNSEKFQEWLQWFDEETQEDSQVVGGTIFQVCDDQGWGSFNAGQIAPWLSTYLAGERNNQKSWMKILPKE